MGYARRTATIALALLAGSACAPVASAFASSTGGESAPSGSSPARPATQAKVKPTAIATWFGPGFYGNKTACGQTLTPAVVGVANRTLPCGTLVKVVYRSRAIVLPVLDRGPYSHIGADWDLTAGAAQALGISDTVRIHTRVVGSAPNTPSLGAPAPSPGATIAGGAVAG